MVCSRRQPFKYSVWHNRAGTCFVMGNAYKFSVLWYKETRKWPTDWRTRSSRLFTKLLGDLVPLFRKFTLNKVMATITAGPLDSTVHSFSRRPHKHDHIVRRYIHKQTKRRRSTAIDIRKCLSPM